MTGLKQFVSVYRENLLKPKHTIVINGCKLCFNTSLLALETYFHNCLGESLKSSLSSHK